MKWFSESLGVGILLSVSFFVLMVANGVLMCVLVYVPFYAPWVSEEQRRGDWYAPGWSIFGDYWALPAGRVLSCLFLFVALLSMLYSFSGQTRARESEE